MIAPDEDIALTRGNTATVRFAVWADDDKTQPADLSGASLHFRAAWNGGQMLRASPAEIIISGNHGDMALSAADTRALPCGRIARYELELREAGRETTIKRGYLVVAGGINTD